MRFVRSDLFDLELSVLGFGAAAVLGRSGRRDSLTALGAAYDVGINVFDTARSYGYGESEALLGEFLKGRRNNVVISSKFGILPAKPSLWKNAAKPIARAAIQAIPMLGKQIRKRVRAQFQPGHFSVANLEASVETSLKKLGTDYLDILFVHEATLEAVNDDELAAAMQRLLGAGKLRVIGVSAEPEIAAIAMDRGGIQAIQFACHIGNGFASKLPKRSESKPMFRAANHPFGGVQGAEAIKNRFGETEFGKKLSADLREKLGMGDRRGVLADVILNIALNGNDIVLATMMNPLHLQINAAAVSNSRFKPDELHLVRDWLLEEWAG